MIILGHDKSELSDGEHLKGHRTLAKLTREGCSREATIRGEPVMRRKQLAQILQHQHSTKKGPSLSEVRRDSAGSTNLGRQG
jgi:hypothetical protein